MSIFNLLQSREIGRLNTLQVSELFFKTKMVDFINVSKHCIQYDELSKFSIENIKFDQHARPYFDSDKNIIVLLLWSGIIDGMIWYLFFVICYQKCYLSGSGVNKQG